MSNKYDNITVGKLPAHAARNCQQMGCTITATRKRNGRWQCDSHIAAAEKAEARRLDGVTMRPYVKAVLFVALCLSLAGIGLAGEWQKPVKYVVVGVGSQAMTLELSKPIDPSGFGEMELRAEAFRALERMAIAQMKAGTFNPARAAWASQIMLNSTWQCQADARMVMAPCGRGCYYAVGCMSGGQGGGCCGISVVAY